MTASAQGEDRSDFQAVQAWTGLDFGMVKATEGTSWRAATFAANWAALRAEGKPRGAYHFLHPDLDPVAQARHFIGFIRASGGLEPGDMLVADSEILAGLAAPARAHLPVTADAAASAPPAVDTATKAFLDEVCRLVSKAHHPVLTYTNHAVGQYLHQTAAAYPELWFAWPSPVAPDAAMITPWKRWRFWQWGIKGGMDRDAYNGTATALHHWLAGYKRQPMTPGHAAYKAYGDAVDWKNYQGQQMPWWADLPEAIRAAWEAAAKAARAMP